LLREGFSWVIDKKLAGLPWPGVSDTLDADAEYLSEMGVGLLVSLTSMPPDFSVLAKYGIESLHLPILDFHPPTLQQQVQFVEATDSKLAEGKAVGVHCAAGMGRTGTMLATYLVRLGRTSDQAISEIRDLRPGSIETAAQEAAIHAFQQYLLRG